MTTLGKRPRSSLNSHATNKTRANNNSNNRNVTSRRVNLRRSREQVFINKYLQRAQNIRATVKNLNKVGANNKLTFNATPGSNFNESNGKKQVILSLVNKSKQPQAWLAVQPKILKKSGKILTYFTLGMSKIQHKGYGLFLRAIADRIGRNIGAQGSNQWAVNIKRMAAPGQEPPSAGIMRKLAANTYKHPSPNRAHGVHFFLDPSKSKANNILKKKFKVVIPKPPRNYMNQFFILSEQNIPKNAMTKNNAHELLIKKIKDPNLMNALDRAKRRVSNNRISPYNLMQKYFHMFSGRANEIEAIQQRMTKRRKTIPGPRLEIPQGNKRLSYYNFPGIN